MDIRIVYDLILRSPFTTTLRMLFLLLLNHIFTAYNMWLYKHELKINQPRAHSYWMNLLRPFSFRTFQKVTGKDLLEYFYNADLENYMRLYLLVSKIISFNLVIPLHQYKYWDCPLVTGINFSFRTDQNFSFIFLVPGENLPTFLN